ncbi:MAG: ABC transporter substrate-binding protein [Lachnospiraceae bacterium]|nr:ABC transporter substrate-binding protein [Lachnospiraceae bacterium]
MKKRKLSHKLLTLLLAAACLAGCGGAKSAQGQTETEVIATADSIDTTIAEEIVGKTEESEAQGPYTFVDDLGQEITVENPERVVTLMGSFAEIWVLAGGADSLVGTSEDTTDNRELGIPETAVNVGTYQNPNMEELLALDPDLVILSAETVRTDNHMTLKSSLEAAGIPAAYFSVTHFEDYLKMLKICTDITGNSEAYEKNGLQVQKQIEQILADTELGEEPAFLLLITYSGGVRPQNSDSMTGRMLTELGAHNIIDDYPSLLTQFSMEEVIEVDPDYIFVIAMGNDDEATRKNLEESIESNPAWSSLTAVVNERYILLPREQFLYKPNAKWADSYQYLADLMTK